MKKLTILLLIGAAAAVAFPAHAWAKPRIGIPKFDHQLPSVGEGIADILARELFKSGRFSVIERSELEALLSEIDFEQSRYVEAESAVPLGEVKGVDYLLIGKITAFGVKEKEVGIGAGSFGQSLGLGGLKSEKKTAYASFDLRLVEVATGKVVFADTAEGEEKNRGLAVAAGGPGWAAALDFSSDEFRETMIGRATYKAIGKVLLKLYERFPLEGRVLVRKGDVIIADLSPETGLPQGAMLRILRVTAICDEKGNVVWQTMEEAGSARISEFQGGNCMAEIVTGRNEIEAGMLVRPAEDVVYLPPEAAEEVNQPTS